MLELDKHHRSKSLYFSLFNIFLVIGILLSLILLLSPQASFIQDLLLGFCLFFFLSVILFLIWAPLNFYIINYLNTHPHFYIVGFGLLMVIPLINWLFLSTINDAILVYIVWYVIPVCFLLFGKMTKIKIINKISSILAVIAVLLLGYGFDTRKTYVVVQGFEDMGYNLNALWVSSIILYWLCYKNAEFLEKMTWSFRNTSLAISIIGFLILSIIIIPLGILTGFIQWNPDFSNFFYQLPIFLGIWFTIALPEELIVRSIIQHESFKFFTNEFPKHKIFQFVVVLILASFIFGLSHWNNTSSEFMWIYILFATVAGIGYGICWHYEGLFSAMLLHTLVDWVWQLLFK